MPFDDSMQLSLIAQIEFLMTIQKTDVGYCSSGENLHRNHGCYELLTGSTYELCSDISKIMVSKFECLRRFRVDPKRWNSVDCGPCSHVNNIFGHLV